MAKLVVCIALFCLALVAVHSKPSGGPKSGSQGGSDKRGPHGSHHGHGDRNQWKSEICENTTIADEYLRQTRALLTQLKGNDSFANVLEKRQNEVNYINDENNTGLISSNCTQFFTGLDAAHALDKQAAQQEWQYHQSANQQLRDIVKTLLGDNTATTADDDDF